MLNRLSGLVSCAAALCALSAAAFAAGQPDVVISDGWMFRAAPEREELQLADQPGVLRFAAPAPPGNDWQPVRVPGAWFEQGFNPSRAGWYRCAVAVPAAWAGKLLAVEFSARGRSELVFWNGRPVGARVLQPGRTREPLAAAERHVFLVPPGLTRQAPCVLAIRVDAPGVERPGLAGQVTLRPASVRDQLAAGTARTDDPRPRQFVEGLGFFARGPVRVGGLLVRVVSPANGCAFVLGEDAAKVKLLAAASPAGTRKLTLAASCTIVDDANGAEVSLSDVSIDVPPEGAERDIELFAGRCGAFSVRFRFATGGAMREELLHYAVLPKSRPASPASPFGAALSAAPGILRPMGLAWLMQPAVLDTSLSFSAPGRLSDEVLGRMQADARSNGYRLLCPNAKPPDVCLLPDDADARAAYLRLRAGEPAVIALFVPQGDGPLADRFPAPDAASYCDVLCARCEVPADFDPEAVVPEKAQEVLRAAADSPAPPAAALILSSQGKVSAAKVVRSCLLGAASGLWKTLWDGNASGWITPEGVPGPQAAAVACMAGVLGEGRFLGRLETEPHAYALAFHSGTEIVIAAWTTGPAAVLKTPPARLVLGAMGEHVGARASDGATEVTLAGAPVYFCGVPEAGLGALRKPEWTVPSFDDLLGRAGRMLAKEPARGVLASIAPERGAFTGGANAAVLTLQNFGPAPVAGTLALDLPQGWRCDAAGKPVDLKPLKAQGWQIELPCSLEIPPDAALGSHAIAASIAAGDGKKGIGTIAVSVTTPLGGFPGIELCEVHTSAPSLAVPVSNPLKVPVQARVKLSVQDWTIQPEYVPVGLGPGESRLLRFIVDGRLPVVGPLLVTVTVAQDGRTLPVRRTVDISRQRIFDWVIGKPEVQAARFDGRRLTYNLTKMAVVSVRIYDPDGILVRTLDAGWQPAGPHSCTWAPDREVDDFGEPIDYEAEVRAGLDFVFDRRIPLQPDSLCRPTAVAACGSRVCALEGPRAALFAPGGTPVGSGLPGGHLAEARGLSPTPGAAWAGLLGHQLVLVDADGRAVRAVPAQPAEGGDIAPGHLRSPTSLAVSGEGMIYVADTGNHRVQRFSMQLEPAPFAAGSSCIGRIDATGCPAAGAGNGEFTAPSLVAVCPGLFCVADATGRLQTFAADGRHLRTVDLQLKDACGLAVEPDGSVYVARAGSNRIVKYDAAGKPAPAFGAEGVATLECSEVLSLAAAGGRLFACCRQPDAVAVLDAAGKQAGILGLPPAAGGPGMPAGIDVDSQGGIFLADAWAQRVVRLSQSGEVLWSVPDARQPVDLERPVDVVLQPGGGLCVLDGGAGRRILVLDVLGRPQQGFGGGGVLQSDELKKAVMIDADDRGGVWAGDAERGVLFDAGGNALMWSLPPPWAKATAGGITYVPLQEAGESFIVIRDGAGRELARKGGTGSGVASLGGCRPGGLAAAAGGPGKPDRIYYADAANRRIAVFRAEWSSISRAFRER